MSNDGRLYPTALGVIFKSSPAGRVMLTQTRNVPQDVLYHGTYECVGGTLATPDEPYLVCLLREIPEETGTPIGPSFTVYGEGFERIDVERVSTRPDDAFDVIAPLCFVQSIRSSRMWHALGFAVEVPHDWEPNPEEADGEATDPRWWTPRELLGEMKNYPDRFMGLHVPLLKRVAKRLAAHP